MIAPNVAVGPFARVGAYSLLNSPCCVAHNTEVSNYNVKVPIGAFPVIPGSVIGTFSASTARPSPRFPN